MVCKAINFHSRVIDRSTSVKYIVIELCYTAEDTKKTIKRKHETDSVRANAACITHALSRPYSS